MPLAALLTGDLSLRQAAMEALPDDHTVASTAAWERLYVLVRERPVTVAILDSAALPATLGSEAAVSEFRGRFPSVSSVLLARSATSPLELFRLGRAGIEGLVPLALDDLQGGLARATARALATGTTAYVLRAVGSAVATKELDAIRLAMEGPQRGWSADDLASAYGLSRAHLSVRLREAGLPSVGHLLVWAKLLHAGRWIADPGRSAESISRQLEYSSGAAFRRALRNYVGSTPTELRAKGSLRPVLDQFMTACGLEQIVADSRSVA